MAGPDSIKTHLAYEIEDDREAPAADELATLLRARFSSPSYKPPMLPVVAVELAELSHKPGVDIDEVVSVLERDPILAGRVLRLVQSPVYAGRSPIRSLKQAVVRLGLGKLRDAVLEVAMTMRIFRSGTYAQSLERLRRHSTAVAYLSRVICYYTSMEGEYAFLCGLLHDVGIAASLLVLGERPQTGREDLVAIWASIDTIHEEAGGVLARLWSLPPDIQLVIANHHHIEVDGQPHPLICTISIAHALAAEFGAGLAGVDADHNFEKARQVLRINDQMMKLIRAEGRDLIARLPSGE